MHQPMMQSIPNASGTSPDPRRAALCHAVAVLPADSLINQVYDRPLRVPAFATRGPLALRALLRACCFTRHAL